MDEEVGCPHMCASSDSSKPAMQEKRKVLSMLREMWLEGDSPLRRIYSSWEQLEANLELTSEATSTEKRTLKPCPYCGANQNVAVPIAGIFPYQNCKSCKNAFYVSKNLIVRELNDEEKREIPNAWFQVIEDLSRKKVAVVFRIE